MRSKKTFISMYRHRKCWRQEERNDCQNWRLGLDLQRTTERSRVVYCGYASLDEGRKLQISWELEEVSGRIRRTRRDGYVGFGMFERRETERVNLRMQE